MGFRNLIAELKRRNVFRVATAYAIAGWLIIQICATTFPFLNLPEWLITAVIIFVLIGFPLSIIFAWAFELTPEGLKKSQEVDITESVTSRTGKKLNGIIITVLSMAVIFLLVERIFFAESAFIENQSELADVQTASIAVLPFVNMSGDENNEYFSDGLSEELLNALAKIENMKVAGRTSSFKFKGQNEDLKYVGDQLGVNHILEGSVRKSGGRVRITAQLIKVEDGFHMWSETFDRELTATNIFEIQEEISKKVLRQLKVRLLATEEAELDEIPTRDIEAYQSYLKANQLLVNRNYDEIEAAIDLYKTAIRLDPSFATAHGGLALAYNSQGYYGNIPRDEMIQNMKNSADQALAIDENTPSAQAALGHYYTEINDNERALEAFKRSLELNPNFSDVYNWLGNLYLDLGQPEQQFDTYRRGYEVDPLNPLTIYNMARVAIYEGDYDMMESYLQKNIRINPDFVPTYFLKGNIQLGAPFGRMDEAFMDIYKAHKLDSQFPRAISTLVIISMTLDMKETSDYFLQLLHDNYKESFEYRNILAYYGKLVGDFSLYEKDQLRYIEDNNIIPQTMFDYFDMYDYAISTGNIDRVIPKFKAFAPELFSDTLTVVNTRTANQARGLAVLLREKGEVKQVELITEAYCDYAIESENSLKGAEGEATFIGNMANCAWLKNDALMLFEKLNVLYEEYNDTIVLFNILKDIEDNYQDLYTKDIKTLHLKVKYDLRNQKANVIQYLKTEGEWKEEWETED